MLSLKASSRWGRYNICDPSKESCSISFSIKGENEKRISVNLDRPTIEPEDYIDAEDAIYVLEEWIKGIWVSSQKNEVEEFKKFLEDNKEKINEGNKIALIEELKKKRDELDKRIKSLES